MKLNVQPNGEDTFKMGRSTGRLFREKGVSLYKDKEISTTHAKVSCVSCFPTLWLRAVEFVLIVCRLLFSDCDEKWSNLFG